MGRTEVRETLTEFEPGRVLAYVLDGSAGPFASASSRWSTSPSSENTTAVTVEGRFEPKKRLVRVLVWPLAKPMLRRLTRRIIGELEEYVTAATAARSG
jgi:ribosome-associated toxin RatA of RatAB toxin-antitoxin module